MLRGHEGKLLVDDTRFDERRLRDRVDLEDLAHACHLERDAAADRDRAAGKAGAGAPWHHRDSMLGGDLDHGGHMFSRRREHHRVRDRSLDRAVAFEDAEVVGRVDDRFAADDPPKLFSDRLGKWH